MIPGPDRTSGVDRLVARLQSVVYWSGWPFRLTRVFGHRPEVRTTRYVVPLPGADPPLTLALASDFHAGPTTNPALLRSACDALRAEAADVLLLGGDFVTLVASEIDWLAAELNRIPARYGRFAVLGNHDWCTNPDYIIDVLEQAGIRVLINQNVRLPQPYDGIWICGLDDYGYGQPDAAAALAGADGIRIVLMHAPSGLLNIRDERFELAVCGHTHGGQIAFPVGRAAVVPHGPLSRRYNRGRFSLSDGRTLIVSVGLGCVVLPLRVYADPEIIVCTLTHTI